ESCPVQSEELQGVFAEQPILDVLRQIQRFDECARLVFSEGKRIIRTQGDSLRADQANQVKQGFRIVHQRIEIKAAKVTARARFIVLGAKIRSHLETVIDAADRTGERPAAMGETEA